MHILYIIESLVGSEKPKFTQSLPPKYNHPAPMVFIYKTFHCFSFFTHTMQATQHIAKHDYLALYYFAYCNYLFKATSCNLL